MLEQVVGSPEFIARRGTDRKTSGTVVGTLRYLVQMVSPEGTYTEAQLDGIVRAKYPTAKAYWTDLPNILKRLGFTPERSAYLQAAIDVEPSRGPGHAMPRG